MTPSIRALEESGIVQRSAPDPAARRHRRRVAALPHAEVSQDRQAGRRMRAAPFRTGDTDIGPNSWDVAAHAVGGVLNAVDAVISGRARNAFCAVRPPGHHASARSAAWAFACSTTSPSRPAMRSGSMASERVLIVDWDVHHGNGTQDIFYSDRRSFSSARTSGRSIPAPAARMKPVKAGRGNHDEFPVSGWIGPRGNPGRCAELLDARGARVSPRVSVDFGRIRFAASAICSGNSL